MNIKPWTDRTPAGQYLAGIDRLQEVMQAEIDELRAELASTEALQIATYTQVVVLDEKLEAQRKVLEQAYMALLHAIPKDTAQASEQMKAITAIQGALHG